MGDNNNNNSDGGSKWFEYGKEQVRNLGSLYRRALEALPEPVRDLKDKLPALPSVALAKERLTGPVPPFSLTEPRYDQSKMFGRVLYRYQQCDPSTLLITNSELITAKRQLENFREGKRGSLTDAMLWNARRIKEAVVHPDTGETIFPLFRFSAFAPVNIFIVSIMLAPR